MYPLRKCTTYSKKPCLYYHIGECLGYCTHNIDENKIEQMKSDIIKFLRGDHSILTNKLESEMLEESSKMNYEKAKELKEILDYIKITLTKQKVEINDLIDRDIFGFYEDKGYLSIQVLFIREGKIIERHSKILPIIEDLSEDLTNYIAKFYDRFILPKEILVPSNVDIYSFSEIFNIKFINPIRGEKKKILDLAYDNARIYYEEQMTLFIEDTLGYLKIIWRNLI